MKIYLKGNWEFAGKPIYQGFASAWEKIGYDVQLFNDTPTPDLIDGEYEIMMTDYDLALPQLYIQAGSRGELVSSTHPDTGKAMSPKETVEVCHRITQEMQEVLRNAKKVYMYVQPTKFPLPWGENLNFRSMATGTPLIEWVNQSENTVLWQWGEMTDEIKREYFFEWKHITKVPLAFDSISYKPIKDPAYNYDVCYVGGWANNGFNEKKQIMMEHFKPLMKMGLKCGVFINKGLSHEQENLILYNSKVALNIHDSYQRILGNDSNERTFKSLGLTGALVCDNIRQISSMFPDLPLYDSPGEMVEQIASYLENEKLLKETKDHYRQLIADNHTYVHRVEQMRDL